MLLQTMLAAAVASIGSGLITPPAAQAQTTAPHAAWRFGGKSFRRDPLPLPGQLDFEARPIVFRNGVPVGGWSHVTLYSDGRYRFNGHFHVSGAPSYNVGIAWMVRSSAGQAFLFSKKGHLHGTFQSGSRNFDWNDNGSNEEIKRNWAALEAGSTGKMNAKVNVDIASIIANVKQAVEIAGQVVKIIQVVAP